jgi:L-serine dehydratase
MPISVFNLFSIGIGPSSSHTVGPIRAARQFLLQVEGLGLFEKVAFVKTDLYGSLALTGKGHCTDLAIMLGLEGETPEGVDPDMVQDRIARIRHTHHLNLLGKKVITFDESQHLLFHIHESLPYHPNAMRFTVYDKDQSELYSKVIYSVGGGFIVDEESAKQDKKLGDAGTSKIQYPFRTAEELLKIGKETKLSIAQIVMENEKTWRTEEEVRKGLLNIWDVMKKCIERGCHQEGTLPGGLNLKRRAKKIYEALTDPSRKKTAVDVMEWVSVWALAVNEENAAGSRVVTAPTNGSAGVIPSVIQYYERYTEHPSEDGLITFMLTAGAMGILFKEGASISAAEMGCMGEVGVACSMAAGGLTAALGGTNEQIENAAEIGMEHNLGLTCDPVKGLVQIPCIERNTMGAVKAINAAMLALQGDGTHYVSLDSVIATMRQTGKDMNTIYKETSLGGLAVNVPEC